MRDLIIYDDPVRPEKEPPTEEQKKKIKSWYEQLVANNEIQLHRESVYFTKEDLKYISSAQNKEMQWALDNNYLEIPKDDDESRNPKT